MGVHRQVCISILLTIFVCFFDHGCMGGVIDDVKHPWIIWTALAVMFFSLIELHQRASEPPVEEEVRVSGMYRRFTDAN